MQGGLKIAVRHMSVVRLSCYAQNHIFAKGKWRWNMPEATGVLPESAKIDPSGPCFGTPFCSFRVNLGTSVIKKCAKNDALDPVLEHLFVVSELTWEHP